MRTEVVNRRLISFLISRPYDRGLSNVEPNQELSCWCLPATSILPDNNSENSVCTWVRILDCGCRVIINHFGWSISHSSNGTRKLEDFTPCTTHLHHRKKKILNCWNRIRERYAPMPMTW